MCRERPFASNISNKGKKDIQVLAISSFISEEFNISFLPLQGRKKSKNMTKAKRMNQCCAERR